MNKLEESEGYKLGYSNAYKKERGELIDIENPFEPDFYEYDDYFDGVIDGKDYAKLKKENKND